MILFFLKIHHVALIGGGTEIIMITAADITKVLRDIGVKEGDILNVHSSLRSVGEVEGGIDAIIKGLSDSVGKEGTLVMPTLCQVDFHNSYKTWYMDKPSDVGFLTEYFRKLPRVYRSNHATHSVAARGKLAYELTYEHSAYGPRLCPFGEYAFAESSPWEKMYRLNAKVFFLGVNTRANTMKHLIECKVMEYFLGMVKDPKRYAELKSQVMTFETHPYNIWCGYNSNSEDLLAELNERKLLKYTKCGDADCILFEATPFCDTIFELLTTQYEKYYGPIHLPWIKACLAEGEKEAK